MAKRMPQRPLEPGAAEILGMHGDVDADAGRALREFEARSRAFMQANPDMLMRVSRDGRHLDVHIPEHIAAFLPMGKDSFLGKTVDEMFEPEFALEHRRCRIKAIETGEMQRWQYSRQVGGRTRYLEARFLRGGDDEVVVAVSDVTERVELEREVVNAIERERNRIGRDLHDGLGQMLTGIKLILEPVRRRIAAESGAGSANVEQALELINLAIAQVSELARGLSPVPRGGGLTFVNALEELAKQATRLFRIDCGVSQDGVPDDVGEERAINLYRIAQEAITNAVKHGRAHRVHLDCRVEGGMLKLAVEDDGVGVAGAEGQGMGMHIMRYRARALGGALSVSAGEKGGTVVRCSCPLPAA